MEDKCIHIIKTKSYHSLNNEEKELIIKWCKNEDDFISLKNLLIGVDSYKENNISKTKKETKKSLDKLFNDVYSSKKSSKKGLIKKLFPESKAFYFKPGFQIAAVLVLAFLAIPKILDLNIDSSSKKIAKTKIVNQNKNSRTKNKSTKILKSQQHSKSKELNKHKKETLTEKTIETVKNKQQSTLGNNLNGKRNDLLVKEDNEEIVELSMGIVDKNNNRLIVNPVIDNPEILDLLSPTF